MVFWVFLSTVTQSFPVIISSYPLLIDSLRWLRLPRCAKEVPVVPTKSLGLQKTVLFTARPSRSGIGFEPCRGHEVGSPPGSGDPTDLVSPSQRGKTIFCRRIVRPAPSWVRKRGRGRMGPQCLPFAVAQEAWKRAEAFLNEAWTYERSERR